MTLTVRFYHLKSPRESGKLFLACKLVETAYRKKHKVFVSCPTHEQCEKLNSLLWTYSWSSFIPHQIQSAAPIETGKYPVLIGTAAPQQEWNDVLVSLHEQMQEFAGQFNIVVEPVDFGEQDSESVKQREMQYSNLTGISPEHISV